jgi:hypothetical protein
MWVLGLVAKSVLVLGLKLVLVSGVGWVLDLVLVTVKRWAATLEAGSARMKAEVWDY